jgi:hypothetical protein
MADGINPKNYPSSEEFMARRRRRNIAVFGAIVLLCVMFYLITIIRVGGAG